MAVHMRNGIQYGGIPNGTVKGVNPSTVPTTVKQLNQIGTVGDIAPVTIPSAVKFSNGDTLETAIGSVATIETSPAVAAHDAGEYIFYNGQMYKVIAAIAVGETLTVDTNIEATSVGDELTSLNNGLMWKQATDYFDAYANAKTEIMLIGQGTSGTSTVAMSMIVPKIAITASPTVWLNGDSYNGSSFIHLQANLSTTNITGIGMYLGNGLIPNATYKWLYR